MRARHYIQIAAMFSMLALMGAAMAQNTEGTTSPIDRGAITDSNADTPSSGAIVTPQDKALRMGKDDARAGNGNDDMNNEASRPNHDRSIINPGKSEDEESMTNPGPSDNEQAVSPPSNRPEPGDMGPGNVRGQ